ncbi:hypothetical protein [Sphingomonas parapaucimobilis]|jgi:hypothetical protein|uniref:Uncharacterized protein n=1 Tax=Sphingomonas parapaucimobilis NBRC 15100 TaxID=1219049 RepID=A0A0A1WC89_9SPHN|nr:hypothetical protein SP5_094_00010 [Sphingomonas parapaucimobilis NBRC 15100]
MTAPFLAASETSDQWISISRANVARIIIDVPSAMLTRRLLVDLGRRQALRITISKVAVSAGGKATTLV